MEESSFLEIFRFLDMFFFGNSNFQIQLPITNSQHLFGHEVHLQNG
jgi:hypothetical protein